MDLLTILGIAVALAMDAFAVAIATGVTLKNVGFRQTFRLSWHFGLFQALMPVLGWYFGTSIEQYVSRYAHWIAFFLLFMVGANMIREAIAIEEESQPPKKDATKGMTLVMLSVATSIDALAVGLSLSLLQVSIVYPAVVIGLVAGLFTMAGLHLGTMAAASRKISPIAEIAGGLVLWLIGFNILYRNGALAFLG